MGYAPDLSGVTNGQPFSFTADAPGYVKSRSASAYNGTVLNSYPATNPNFDVNAGTSGATRTFSTADYFTGNQQNGTNNQTTFGSYIINSVVTDNVTSLSANNEIIHSTPGAYGGDTYTAGKMTLTNLEKLAGVKGVGVLSDLTVQSNGSDAVSAITGDASSITATGTLYKTYGLNWTLGTTTAVSTLGVVNPSAYIAQGSAYTSTTDPVAGEAGTSATDAGQYALFATNAILTGDEAKALTDGPNTVTPNESATPAVYANGLNYYTEAFGMSVVGHTDGQATIEAPTWANQSTLLPALQNVSASGTETANYTYHGLFINPILTINYGFLALSVPSSVDFSTLSIQPTNLMQYGTPQGNPLVVTDTRGTSSTGWSLYVAQTSPLVQVDASQAVISGGNDLSNTLYFNNGTTNNALASGSTPTAVLVHSENAPAPNGDWTAMESHWGNPAQGGVGGVNVNIPVQQQEKGTYLGTLTWTLNDTPAN
jgi:hypothetical protein